MKYEAKPVFFYDPASSTPQIREAMELFLKSWLPKHSSIDELKLYHYTTLKGLEGIINSRSIWLTHVSTLNDPSELKYGEEIILNLLDEVRGEERDENILQLIKYLSEFVKSFNAATFQTYVACFCEEENLLSQWRAYGARGGGYNLGFRFGSTTKFYHSLDEEKNSHVILRKIIYDLDEQRKLISNYISSIIKSTNKAIIHFKETTGIPDAWSTIAATEAVNILLDLKLSFKNPVFAEEKEWRLIKGRQADYKPEQLMFRESNDGFIPYLKSYIYMRKRKEGKYFQLVRLNLDPHSMKEEQNQV